MPITYQDNRSFDFVAELVRKTGVSVEKAGHIPSYGLAKPYIDLKIAGGI